MQSIPSYTLQTYSILPQELEGPLYALDSLCFRENYTQTSADRKDQDDKFCSDADLICYILAHEKDDIIGETRVFKRAIVFDNQTIVLGGIGSVGTRSDRRHLGVATAMLTQAMKFLADHACDVAYLCADTYNRKLVDLYGRFGFVLLDKEHTYLGKSGKRYIDRDGMVAPVASAVFIKKILSHAMPFDIGVGNW